MINTTKKQKTKKKREFYFCQFTLLHSSKQLKQNWCIHESVKHLLLTRPKQIEQFGGGEWAIWRCWSSLLFSESTAVGPAGDRRSCCFFKNSRIRKLVGGSPLADAVLSNSTVIPSPVGHSRTNSAILFVFMYLSFVQTIFTCLSSFVLISLCQYLYNVKLSSTIWFHCIYNCVSI